ncbi:MAG: universal stress protein, partial [Deltaproteobacteria bacterium]|nr:universal stress protein [Deltaproteobacteria bacterium]
MFEKALVATDLSPASDHLLECAGQLGALGVRDVTLLHVAETRFSVGLDESLALREEPELATRASRLREHGYKVEVELARGIAWFEIVDAARRKGSHLIVLASHGRGAIAESLLGGTAARVAENSPIPVLVLRMGLMDKAGGRYCALRFANALDYVLLPTDFSGAARRAFDVVRGFCPSAHRVLMLHVNQEIVWEHLAPEIPAAFEEEDRNRLADHVEALRNAGCPDARFEIARGHGRKVILERAASEEVSLIVLGTRGWSPLKEVVLGSTAHALVRHARAPVLLVPVW